MRALTLIRLGSGKPDPRELEKLEAADQCPRITFFEKALNSDMLDERFLEATPRSRQMLYKLLPTNIVEVLEAYRVRARYDVIISWAEYLGFPFAALLKVVRSHLPHVVICSWISGWKKSLLLRRVQTHIDRIILMSSVQRDHAIKQIGIPHRKVVFLRWPVDQKFWRPVEQETDMICAVGREMRDYRTLIKALSSLEIPCHIAANIFPGKKDRWIRDIEEASPLPSHISVGKKNYAELRELYRRSRFVVIPLYPTDTDNGTTSILEAMAMGRAVICSRVAGQRDIVHEGLTGLFVPPQDPHALREAILYLWNNPEIAATMGRNARKLVEENHTLDEWISNIRSVVEQVVLEKSNGHGRETDRSNATSGIEER